MTAIDISFLRSTLGDLAQNGLIKELAKRNLSETSYSIDFFTYFEDSINLATYDSKITLPRKEAKERASQRFWAKSGEERYRQGEYEPFGSHKELRYSAKTEQGPLVLVELRDSYGFKSTADEKFLDEGIYVKTIGSKEMNPRGLQSGEFDEDLERILSQNPQFEPMTFLKNSILAGIEEHVRRDLRRQPQFSRLLVRNSGFGPCTMYWDIGRPSYVTKNPSWEMIARFEKESPSYVQNAENLLARAFANEPSTKSAIDRIKLTSEDTDKLYERIFDEKYFKKRMRKIKPRRGPISWFFDKLDLDPTKA